MSWHFRSVKGNPRGEEFTLQALPFLIGRGSDCHLRALSSEVSRHHCTLVEWNGHLYVQDCSSRNGTFINGERVDSAAELKEHDLLKVGPLVFEVIYEESESRELELAGV